MDPSRITSHLPGNTENASSILNQNGQYFVMQGDMDTLTINEDQVQFLTQVPAANGQLQQSQTAFPSHQEYYVSNSSAFGMSDCLGQSSTEEVQSDDKEFSLESQETDLVIANEDVTRIEMDVCDSVADNLELSNGTTEITLNQDQWQMMERNCWVLLELNGKIYLLDTLGLHDLSDNPDLIQSLKNEVACSTSQQLEQHGNTTQDATFKELAEATDTLTEQDSLVDNANLNGELDEFKDEDMKDENITKAMTKAVRSPVIRPKPRTVITNKEAIMKFKTNMKAEEIPDKLELGITVNGKKLVARVVMKTATTKTVDKPADSAPAKAINADTSPDNAADEEKTRVDQFFKNFLRNMLTQPKIEDIQKAESVINQLICIPSTRDRLLGQNILVTRNSQLVAQPAYVAGCVVSAGADKWSFKYETQLLQKIMAEKLNKGEASQKDAIMHVHIEEIKSDGGLTKTSITINKQNIRLLPMPKKLVHACAECANLFETEDDLKEHRRKPCIEKKFSPEKTYSKDVLDDYIAKPNEGSTAKSYVCKNCNKSVRARDLKRHATIHMGDTLGGKQSDVEQDLHRCPLCPCVFYHKVTFTKHFKNFHIKQNNNRYPTCPN